MLGSGQAVTEPEGIANIIQNAVSKTLTSFTETLQGEIRTLRTELKSDILESISALSSELYRPECSVRIVEQKYYEDQAVHNTTIVDWLRHIEKLTLKLADQEDRAWHNNIRISGLKEGAEGINAVHFLETQLLLWIPALKDTPMDLGRGHRIYSEKHNGHLRIMIFKCLQFSTRVAILREASISIFLLLLRGTDV